MELVNGIEYQKPVVTLLQETGLGVPEYAARTCYDSFENSENQCVKEADYQLSSGMSNEHYDEAYKDSINGIEHSDLLDTLAWTHFHHSILEHANLSYLIRGTSRGVLQEHARHRLQAISVRSTRYTMAGIINAFTASQKAVTSREWFAKTILDMDMFVTTDIEYNRMEIEGMYNKLRYQKMKVGDEEFQKLSVAKSSLDYTNSTEGPDITFQLLQDGKKKRNVGDAFKHIVTDNWKVDMVVTFNIRSLKNYFGLRDSGAAYFQIQWLAEEMKKVTPQKYLDLIVKT